MLCHIFDGFFQSGAVHELGEGKVFGPVIVDAGCQILLADDGHRKAQDSCDAGGNGRVDRRVKNISCNRDGFDQTARQGPSQDCDG